MILNLGNKKPIIFRLEIAVIRVKNFKALAGNILRQTMKITPIIMITPRN